MNVPVSESYTTLAGFLMAEAGKVLNRGETVSFERHVFTIEDAAKRRILSIRLHAIADSSDGTAGAEQAAKHTSES